MYFSVLIIIDNLLILIYTQADINHLNTKPQRYLKHTSGDIYSSLSFYIQTNQITTFSVSDTQSTHIFNDQNKPFTTRVIGIHNNKNHRTSNKITTHKLTISCRYCSYMQ